MIFNANGLAWIKWKEYLDTEGKPMKLAKFIDQNERFKTFQFHLDDNTAT